MTNNNALVELTKQDQQALVKGVESEMSVSKHTAKTLVKTALKICKTQQIALDKKQLFDIVCCFSRLNNGGHLMTCYLSLCTSVDDVIEYVSELNTSFSSPHIVARLHGATLDYLDEFGDFPPQNDFEMVRKLSKLPKEERIAVIKTSKETGYAIDHVIENELYWVNLK